MCPVTSHSLKSKVSQRPENATSFEGDNEGMVFSDSNSVVRSRVAVYLRVSTEQQNQERYAEPGLRPKAFLPAFARARRVVGLAALTLLNSAVKIKPLAKVLGEDG